ncbi:MAG: type VII secretion protein EccB [Streptosporangiaceae bacterium]|nr:type VII secretion protein EccB [Streptosporangiaceae bacterium]
MQNRKDLLQAHRLMTQRAALALLGGDPDPADQPLRRVNVGTLSGVLVAVMTAAIFGIWGLVSPGAAQGLTAPGTLVIDKQTGTSYIACMGGKLCPVVNYASARLALGGNSLDQRLVSQASLAHYQRGPLIGIPGLPQPLPDRSLLVGQPWSVCVQNTANSATLQQQMLTTLVGGQSVGGTPLAGGSALLVQAQGQDWLLYRGQRLLIDGNMTQNLPNTPQPVPVPAGWLDGVRRGPDFVAPTITGFGNLVQGPDGGGDTVGQVFQVKGVPGSPAQFFVLLNDGGLAPITQTQADLLSFVPGQPALKTLLPSQVTGHLSHVTVPDGGLPARMPTFVRYDPNTALCTTYSGPDPAGAAAAGPGQLDAAAGGPGQFNAVLTVGGSVPANGVPTGGAAGVDRLALPPGAGALVGVVPGPGQGGSSVTSYFLVTEGHRYGLASQDVAAMLGYDLARQRTLLPANIVDLVPAGPALDPAAARQTVTTAFTGTAGQ